MLQLLGNIAIIVVLFVIICVTIVVGLMVTGERNEEEAILSNMLCNKVAQVESAIDREVTEFERARLTTSMGYGFDKGYFNEAQEALDQVGEEIIKEVKGV